MVTFAAMLLYLIFIVAITVQCGYALFFMAGLYGWEQAGGRPKEKPGISVIICAHNEAGNLEAYLPAVLQQQYAGTYEVIVVNDASTDDTAAVLHRLAATYSEKLRVVTIAAAEQRTLKGKKHALGRGVAAASHEQLLLIDADCRPVSNEWLALMTAPLADGKAIVAGYGGYTVRPGLLNAFVRWETLHTFVQYSCYTRAGVPYMAVGRNMACTRQAMLQATQLPAWNELASGDDDLLVRAAATSSNMAVVCAAAAYTRTEAKQTWAAWARQKQRHMSTGKYYKGGIKLLLGAYGTAHATAWIGFFLLLFPAHREAALVAMGVRCLLYWATWARAAMRLKEPGLFFLLPVLDIGWMIYNFAFLPYITWKNKRHWT